MITKELGKRLQELRKERTGLSQEKFAFKIEMDRTYYASVEAGRRNISIINIKRSPTGLAFPSASCLKVCNYLNGQTYTRTTPQEYASGKEQGLKRWSQVKYLVIKAAKTH